MLRRVAPLVGSDGRVVGVDASAAMVEEARRRAATSSDSLPIELVHCSATSLALPSAAFDRVTAGAVLQHLDDPALAIREMARVTRSGGRVLVTEQDWDTLVIDAEPLDLARRMCRCFSDALPNGTIGRRAGGLFARAGLIDVRVKPLTQVITTIAEGDATDRAFAVELAREAALPAGIIDAREASEWREQLLARGREGCFFMSFTAFEISGTKP
jgi:ubiquinone/menaquinone biosynthesis C-methylase UbiE